MAIIPVIVGVADIKNKNVNDAREPAVLMFEAITQAIADAQLSPDAAQQLRTAIDSINVVRTWTWPYADLPGLLTEKLGLQPKHAHYSDHSGNQPAKLLDEAALRIATGQSKVAVITGGEALASLRASAKTGKTSPPGWTQPAAGLQEASPLNLGAEDIGGRHGVGLPIHIYPMYENAFRAHRQQTLAQNDDESAALYAEFAQISARNPNSWNFGKPAPSKEDIKIVSSKNRMICSPYPLLMNAFNTVNLAAACILTSVENAKKLGVPEHKWVYPLSGAGRRESDEFWKRPSFHHSQAISISLDQCLASSGLKLQDVDMFDFYSCFPIVPKLACHHLGIPILDHPKPITLLGGLTSFGGAGNNYSMHAITEMTRQIRSGKAQNGLILANGGVLTYQHAICLSSKPRRHGSSYPDNRAASGKLVIGSVLPVEAFASGQAVIETYTVEFGRDGKPQQAFIVGRLKANGHRFVANHGNQRTLNQLASPSEEIIGKEGFVSTQLNENGKPERNVFSLRPSAVL